MSSHKPFKINYLRLSIILLIYIFILSIVAAIIFSKYLKSNSDKNDYSKILYSTHLNDLKGIKNNLGAFKNKILIINFWAPWCHNCLEELSAFNHLAETLTKDRANIIGISIDSLLNTKHFLSTKQLSYIQFVAEDNGLALSQALGNSVSAVPFTVGINSAGEIFYRHFGKVQINDLIQLIDQNS